MRRAQRGAAAPGFLDSWKKANERTERRAYELARPRPGIWLGIGNASKPVPVAMKKRLRLPANGEHRVADITPRAVVMEGHLQAIAVGPKGMFEKAVGADSVGRIPTFRLDDQLHGVGRAEAGSHCDLASRNCQRLDD